MEITSESCRLCSGSASYRFTLLNMGRYDIKYYVCTSCGSMQTENPFWLEDAYRNPVRYTDTFAADRSLRMPRLTYALAKIFGISPRCAVIDWGGGNGLMTRYMRDLGFDARNYDMYEKNIYSGGFDDEPGKSYDIATSFEVLEHMANPKKELSLLFARNPRILFMSTCFFENQDISWPYLAPYAGRHIFFYTPKGLRQLAAKHGYNAILDNNLIVFYRGDISKWKRRLLSLALSNTGQRLVAIFLTLFPPPGRMIEDWQVMREKVGDTFHGSSVSS